MHAFCMNAKGTNAWKIERLVIARIPGPSFTASGMPRTAQS